MAIRSLLGRKDVRRSRKISCHGKEWTMKHRGTGGKDDRTFAGGVFESFSTMGRDSTQRILDFNSF